MYDKEEILELENKMLLIHSYYTLLKVSFNAFKGNNQKDTETFSYIVLVAKDKIEEMREVLFNLITNNYERYLDYSVVINYMGYLERVVDRSELKYDKTLWNKIVEKIEENGFTHIFCFFINKLRNIEGKFEKIVKNYHNLSNEVESKSIFDQNLTHFGFYLREFLTYVQLTKLIYENLSLSKVFILATARCGNKTASQEFPRLTLVVSK